MVVTALLDAVPPELGFWTKLQKNAFLIGTFLVGVSVGAMGQSALDKSPQIPWLHQQAAEVHHLQTKVIPKLADAAGCQTARARIAVNELQKSESGQDADVNAAPDCPVAPSVKKLK